MIVSVDFNAEFSIHNWSGVIIHNYNNSQRLDGFDKCSGVVFYRFVSQVGVEKGSRKWKSEVEVDSYR